jgi:hypothetical protein
MKKLLTYSLYLATACAGITACTDHQPQRNLLVNGDAEVSHFGILPAGWINVQGHWVTEEADSVSHECGLAQSGKALFFAGVDTLGILRQEVDVREFASGIAAGKQRFGFSGYAESLDQGPTSDQARIVLTSLDSMKKNPNVLFDSDTTRSLNKWLLLRDTVLAPPTTAFIRVDLIAIRHVGGDNDGYFDNITLVALPQTPNVWIWLIAIVLAIAVGIVIYRRTKRKPATNLTSAIVRAAG